MFDNSQNLLTRYFPWSKYQPMTTLLNVTVCNNENCLSTSLPHCWWWVLSGDMIGPPSCLKTVVNFSSWCHRETAMQAGWEALGHSVHICCSRSGCPKRLMYFILLLKLKALDSNPGSAAHWIHSQGQDKLIWLCLRFLICKVATIVPTTGCERVNELLHAKHFNT